MLVLLSAAIVRADDDVVSVPRQTGQADAVLLFRSGRAMQGRITQTDSHYIVTRTTGRIEIPKAEVEFVGADLEAVFQYKLKQINPRDPEAFARLGQWCLSVNLNDRAVAALERAFELSPQSSRIRGLLETARRTNAAPPRTSLLPPVDEKSDDSAEPSPRQLAAFQQEVPTPLLSNFSVQIQPMLTRSCATAGCHDTAHKSGLALQRSPRPIAHVTQQNLRAVLANIDRDDPDNSPILAYSVRPHGGPNSRPFAKGAGDPAYLTLAEWVRAISGKPTAKSGSQTDQATTARQESSTEIRTTPEIPTVTPPESNPAVVPAIPPVTVPTNPPRGERNDPPRNPVGNPRLDAVAKSNVTMSEPAAAPFQPVDPFDPEIFNRRFAPRPK